MKRIIVKRWDETNRALIVRYYRVFETCVAIREYQSPIWMRDRAACKGNMRQVTKQPIWLGCAFVDEVKDIMDGCGGDRYPHTIYR